jgi:integrase
MPKLYENAVPSYRLHKQSGQGIVTLSGKDFLLGPHGSAASRSEYHRLTAEWLANGRQLGGPHAARLTVNELILAFWRHAKAYYRKDGRPTSEVELVRYALTQLKDLYGTTLAADFRPLSLQAVRERMIGLRWSRKTINGHVDRIRRMFKWAVSQELVPPNVHHGLTAVAGLKRNRSEARETVPVRPVPEPHVDAVIASLSPSLARLIVVQGRLDELGAETAPISKVALTNEARRLAMLVAQESPVAAMVQVQRLTGMRSGELVIMRSRDLDTTGENWLYTPGSHKTQHHDRVRQIYLGPRAQEVLRPFLNADRDAYLFSPRAATVARRKWMRQLRETRVQPSQLDRGRPSPRRTPGLRYDPAAFRRAVRYACKRAGVPVWHPHQLRHGCATRLRRAFGIEAARVVLGHASAAVTELYAEADLGAAARAMATVG